MKVTDLEKWAMEQVWLPYYPLLPEAYDPDTGDRLHANHSSKLIREHIRQLAGKDFLMGTITMLDKRPEFATSITDRLDLIGDHFPTYLNHPLVDWFWMRGHMTKGTGAPSGTPHMEEIRSFNP